MSLNKHRAVIFDLDGTLLDTIDDLADSMNKALSDLGFPVHDTEYYKRTVGDGLPKLVERVLPEGHRDRNTFDRCIREMEGEYQKRWKRKTQPYNEIPELLAGLIERKVKMNVVSNKLDTYTQMAVVHYFPRFPFEYIVGASSSHPRKPDPECALIIAKCLNIDPQQFIFLGDTGTDMKTAVAAGMFPVGALWGFRSENELKENGAKAVIDHPLKLLEYF
ncbi:MAG: HAD family hydrolase [Candidatus Aminicenantes bacterium]